mmetsp:Transcript_18118/g.45069  ORF Transcript_18118/g.45069 Transcript_18118/m.45069 type:complete len:117 (+) Transcript_18118:323-673(+)
MGLCFHSRSPAKQKTTEPMRIVVQSAQALPKDDDLCRMDPKANPVNTIPIFIAPANKLNTVARVPLSPIAEFSADPRTGQAKPRTKLSNHDAPIALAVFIKVTETKVVNEELESMF